MPKAYSWDLDWTPMRCIRPMSIMVYSTTFRESALFRCSSTILPVHDSSRPRPDHRLGIPGLRSL
jgi:hypothetical protein